MNFFEEKVLGLIQINNYLEIVSYNKVVQEDFEISKSEFINLSFVNIFSPKNIIYINDLFSQEIGKKHNVKLNYKKKEIIFQILVEKIEDGYNIYLYNLNDFTKVNSIKNNSVFVELVNFEEQVNSVIRSSLEEDKVFYLYIVNLSRLERIYDNLGFKFAEQLISAIQDKLFNVIWEVQHLYPESSFLISKISSGVFSLCFHNFNDFDEKHCNVFEEKLRSVFETKFFLKGNYTFMCHASMGFSVFPMHGLTYEDLLKKSFLAVKNAKMLGNNCCTMFNDSMSIEDNGLFSRHKIELLLNNAIKNPNDNFFLVFQPQFNGMCEIPEIIGAEVLIRWKDSNLGFVSPATFIPLAEEIGLISEIENWVLNEVGKKIEAWNYKGYRFGKIAINISSNHFQSSKFIREISSLFENYDILPSQIELEITESCLLDFNNRTKDTMDWLESLGITMSIDDFGTGYSSLSYLKKLKVKKLKIDQGFIRDLENSSEDREIVNAIIKMAKGLKLDVIAEGVETEKQKIILGKNGCYNMQGYFFSKPLPLEDFEKLIKKNRDNFNEIQKILS